MSPASGDWEMWLMQWLHDSIHYRLSGFANLFVGANKLLRHTGFDHQIAEGLEVLRIRMVIIQRVGEFDAPGDAVQEHLPEFVIRVGIDVQNNFVISGKNNSHKIAPFL